MEQFKPHSVRAAATSAASTLGLSKTRRSGPPREVSYASFSEAEIICPVNTLKVYLQQTEKFRSVAEDGSNPLFIAIRKPHKPVTSATISRWMKNLMEQSDIDVEQFKPHSVRAAATSAASTLGLSKTRRSGPPREVSYASFSEAEIICPVNTLKVYLQQTEKFRSVAEDGSNPLFIAIRKPHKPVTSATISRWMKNLMEQSDIDVEQFKPHSVRAAATSAASTLGLSKTRRSGPPREVSYASFSEAEIICPVNTLKVYLQQTEKFCSVAEDGSNPLFIAIRKPHKPVTSATISRWMKNLMEQSGIDVEQFKPHSVRAAATSAASTLGVSIKDILKTANWARESTFLKFYHKPIIKDKFGKAILNGR